jgi:hypothetical protein
MDRYSSDPDIDCSIKFRSEVNLHLLIYLLAWCVDARQIVKTNHPWEDGSFRLITIISLPY